MAALRSLLSGLVISAVLTAGLSVPASAASGTVPVEPAAAVPQKPDKPKKEPREAAPKKRTGANFVLAAPTDAPAPLMAAALAPATANGAGAGSRGAASMVDHQLTDLVKLSFNPTNGNVLLTGRLLQVKGPNLGVNVNWRYNSLTDTRPTLNAGTQEAALIAGPGAGEYTYVADDGGWYTFKPNGAGGWVQPPGLRAFLRDLGGNTFEVRFDDPVHANRYTLSGSTYVLTTTLNAYNDVPDSVKYVNASGLLDHTTDIQGRTVHYTYGDARNTSQPSTITDDSLGRTMTIEYGGPGGAMSKITDATQDSIIFSYNAAGKISRIQDGMDNYTALTYDASGRATKIRYADGTGDQADWVPSYGAGTTTVTDPNSRTAVYSFNATNQVTSVKDGNNNTITGGFDAHDNRTSSTDALGNATTATYNAGNALTKITSPAAGSTGTGGTVSYTYPAPTSVKPSSSADSENASSAYTYDGMASYVDKITAPDGNFTTLNYHGDDEHTGCGAYVGQLCRTTDAKGNVTTYDYALTGDPVTVNRPAPLGVITNTFDGASRLLSSKVGTGPTATYIYDDNDRLFQIRYGATCVPATCVKYTYNGAGMLDSRVDASGTTTYVHDSQNRLLSKAAGGTTTSISYDGASNILSFTDPTGTVLYKYDAGNRLISLAEPGGSCPATPAFPNATKCTGFGYDNANRRTTTTYPNGVKNTTAYDKASRIQSITATNTSAGILAKRAYTYTVLTGGQDGALRKTMTTETGAVTTYGYDTRRRLTSATTAGTTETWQYDPNSNRTKDTKTGTADVHSAFNAADQLCWAGASAGTCTSPPGGATTYSYDANGNTTVSGPSTQGYNVFDQFSSNTNGGVTTNYTYAGPRNDERLAAGATGFLNGSLGITRQTTGGASASFIRDPDGTLISMRNSAGASFYYTTDALGSTILLTDSNQTAAATYAYDSWGLATTATGTQAAVNPWTFAGGYNDTASNRIKFGARYYNPYRGRFTQPDPSGQEQNRYAYVNCNPINATDPTGLGPAECLFNASAAVFSAFVVAGAGAAAVATGGLAIVGLIGAIGLEATTATAAGYYCGELIR